MYVVKNFLFNNLLDLYQRKKIFVKNLIVLYGVQCRFQQYFSYIAVASAPYPCFPGILLTSTPHNSLSKPLAAFPHSHC